MSSLTCAISMVGEVGKGLLTHLGGDMDSMEK